MPAPDQLGIDLASELQVDMLKCIGWAAFSAVHFDGKPIAHWTQVHREIDISKCNQRRHPPKWRPKPLTGGLGDPYAGIAWQPDVSLSDTPPISKADCEDEWMEIRRAGLIEYDRSLRGYVLTDTGHESLFQGART